MSTTLSRRTRTGSALASISGFAAAWMAMMATRYFALSADDINGGIGIGVDEGSWLSTAYSACEPIGVILGCWLSVGLSYVVFCSPRSPYSSLRCSCQPSLLDS